MNQNQDRRAFLGLTAGLLGAGMLSHALPRKKQKMQLAFSSIGCPDWPLDKMVKFAREKGYQGLELRGLLRELDLPKSSDFNSPEKIRVARKLVEDNGLKFVCLGASAPLHHPEGTKRDQSIDEGKRFIDHLITHLLISNELEKPNSLLFSIYFLKWSIPSLISLTLKFFEFAFVVLRISSLFKNFAKN
jgi:hypothetical protein